MEAKRQKSKLFKVVRSIYDVLVVLLETTREREMLCRRSAESAGCGRTTYVRPKTADVDM